MHTTVHQSTSTSSLTTREINRAENKARKQAKRFSLKVRAIQRAREARIALVEVTLELQELGLIPFINVGSARNRF